MYDQFLTKIINETLWLHTLAQLGGGGERERKVFQNKMSSSWIDGHMEETSSYYCHEMSRDVMEG